MLFRKKDLFGEESALSPKPLALLFDLGLTLAYAPRDDAMVQILGSFGVTSDVPAVQLAHHRADHYFMRERPGFLAQRPEDFYPEYAQVFLRFLGVTLDPTQLTKRLFEVAPPRRDWRLYPEVIPALQFFAARGYKLGLVSNWDASGPEVLLQLGLKPHLPVALFSALEGVAKPDPAILLRAAQRLQVMPSRTLYVGDNVYDDEAAARAAGMRFVLIERLPQASEVCRGDRERIHDLWGLAALLGEVHRVPAESKALGGVAGDTN